LHFELGSELILGDHINDKEYREALNEVKGLSAAVTGVMGETTNELDIVAWMDITLEALHQHSMLGKEEINQTTKYTDMLGSMLDQLDTSSGYDLE
jgi:magnesium chelatase subunit I